MFHRIKQTIFHASNNIEVPVDLAIRKDGRSHSVAAVADLCVVLHGMLGVEQTGRKKRYMIPRWNVRIFCWAWHFIFVACL